MRPGTDFPYADRFTWSIRPTEDEKSLELTLRLEGLPEDLNGSFGGFLNIEVGHPLKPTLGVRFSGVCRQSLAGDTFRPGAVTTPPSTGDRPPAGETGGEDEGTTGGQ